MPPQGDLQGSSLFVIRSGRVARELRRHSFEEVRQPETRHRFGGVVCCYMCSLFCSGMSGDTTILCADQVIVSLRTYHGYICVSHTR